MINSCNVKLQQRHLADIYEKLVHSMPITMQCGGKPKNRLTLTANNFGLKPSKLKNYHIFRKRRTSAFSWYPPFRSYIWNSPLNQPSKLQKWQPQGKKIPPPQIHPYKFISSDNLTSARVVSHGRRGSSLGGPVIQVYFIRQSPTCFCSHHP